VDSAAWHFGWLQLDVSIGLLRLEHHLPSLPFRFILQVDSPEFTGAGGALEAVQTRLYSDEVRWLHLGSKWVLKLPE